MAGSVSKQHPASFRDPAGFVFVQSGEYFRQINTDGKVAYDLFMDSGLYDELAKLELILQHTEVNMAAHKPSAYKILKPEQLPFISYPYEWSFSQLKDAALATLAIQKMSLKYGMSLKDANGFNIQFFNGRPCLIDQLSFEKYPDGQPWVAYKQFCQHFLAPLALMASVDIHLNQLLRVYPDGIPLDLTSKLLPLPSRLKLGLLIHIHLHSRAQNQYADRPAQLKSRKFSTNAMYGLLENLESTIKNLRLPITKTEWANYYRETNYSSKSFTQKHAIIAEFIEKANPKTVVDLGANSGEFSRIAQVRGIQTISADIDPLAVEKNYLELRDSKETSIFPVVIDLLNPSPGFGWSNQERASFLERSRSDLTMALALVHHLAISANIPLRTIAELCHTLSTWLIIEFVPKQDSQVKRLLSTRPDIFPKYTEVGFEEAFNECFTIIEKRSIPGTKRVLYLMKRSK